MNPDSDPSGFPFSAPMSSKHAIGDIAYFQPVISRIDARTMKSDDTAIPCKVVAVTFTPGKVLYDLALPNGEGGFYEIQPIRGVDSYFVLDQPTD